MRIKLLRQGYSLPLATAGLALLLPWRAADLLQQWHGLSPISHAAAQPAPPAVQSPPEPPARVVASESAPIVDGRLLQEVSRRQAELDRREHDLQTRAAQVAAAEQLARRQITELERLRREVEALAAHEFSAADADLTLLVGTLFEYETGPGSGGAWQDGCSEVSSDLAAPGYQIGRSDPGRHGPPGRTRSHRRAGPAPRGVSALTQEVADNSYQIHCRRFHARQSRRGRKPGVHVLMSAAGVKDVLGLRPA